MNPPDRTSALRPGTLPPGPNASTGLAPGLRSAFDVGDSGTAYSATLNRPAAVNRPRWTRRRIAGAVLLAVLLVAAVVIVLQVGLLDAAEAAVLALCDAGPLVFCVAMAVLPALGFPLMAFTLAAGPVFAPTLGAGPVILWSIAAVVANLLLSYWLSHRAVRPLTLRLLAWFDIPLPNVIAIGAWETTLLVRLAPGVPFWLQSYVLGVLRMPLLPYLVVSTGVIAGYLVVLVYGGQALMQGQGRIALIAAAGLGVLAAIFQLARRHLARRKAVIALQPIPAK